MTRIKKLMPKRSRRRTAKQASPGASSVHATGVLAEPPLGRRALKRIAKREHIRTAAFELFTTLGYVKTSTKAIARRAGVASGTLFLYADDKQDLLFLVYHERLQGVVEQRFAALPAASLREQLMYIFRGLFEMYGEHPDLAVHFIRAFPGATGRNAQAISALTFAFLHRIGGLVREAQLRGEIDRRVDPGVAAQNLFSLYYGALVVWTNQLTSLDGALDPLLASAIALQFRGLLPR